MAGCCCGKPELQKEPHAAFFALEYVPSIAAASWGVCAVVCLLQQQQHGLPPASPGVSAPKPLLQQQKQQQQAFTG